MNKVIDVTNAQPLNVGNSYTYTVLDADKAAYSAFSPVVAATITISDGTNSLALPLEAYEEVQLNSTITTIVGTVDNTIVFLY